MNIAFILLSAALLSADQPDAANPIFDDLIASGVETSNDGRIKLPPPIMPDGLDAAEQRKAIERAAAGRYSVERIMQKSFYAPTVVQVRSRKRASEKGPVVRAVDLWFVVHGDWDVLTSKDFLETMTGTGSDGGDGEQDVVSQSGALSDEEMAKRRLTAAAGDGYEERFVYTTFSLFERVELSATRLAGLSRGENSWLAASRIDRRFDEDPDYPNRWRPLLRNAQAEIKPGKSRPFLHAGGYAKITRLEKPANAIFIECHLVYEEDYGWFDGANLVRQKTPLIVREKVRALRRKLAVATEKAEGETSGEKVSEDKPPQHP